MNELTGAVAHYVEFNNDNSYFAVAVEDGFAIFVSETCELYMEQAPGGVVAMATMLESSQILGIVNGAVVGTQGSNKVTLWDSAKKGSVATITSTAPVVRVRLTKTHIAAVTERSVKLYKHQPRLERLATYETTMNPAGICCLADWILVFPGRTPGQIQLVNLMSLKVDIVPAHSSALRALALSPDGEVVASASDTGTLIRIFSSRTGARIAELRRGVGAATIYSLAISPFNTHLAVTSDTSTLHIFDLPQILHHPPHKEPRSVDGNWQTVERALSPPPVGNKWGGFAKLPFAPRVFTDTYSAAAVQFDPGQADNSTHAFDLCSTALKPPKGITGWLDEETLVVISAGKDARYERFVLTENSLGRMVCFRAGHSRFMRPN